MVSPLVLSHFLMEDPKNFSELVSSCRRIIDAWLSAGGEPTDDLVIGFYGIDGQVNDVVSSGRKQHYDEADFYRTFYPAFITERDKLRQALR